MKAAYLIVFVLFFFGCSKDLPNSTSGIVGEWKLAEVKEGSGIIIGQPVVFEPVQSNKKIIFSADGSFSANGDMCTMSIESTGSSNGLFYESLLSIEPNDCLSAAPSSGINYQLDGDTLFIIYPCYEECVQKYYRI